VVRDGPIRSAADDAVSATSDIGPRLTPLSPEARGTSDTGEVHDTAPCANSPIRIRLDRDSAIPLYQQLYESIRDAIQDARLAAGARLPSTRILAAELSVSRKTVLVAFQRLLDEGLVHGHVGAGTWVSMSVDPSAADE
jgi:hypothetical protein